MEGYEFTENKQCAERYGITYSTMSEAKGACDQDSLCTMFDNYQCDGSVFQTCKGHTASSSTEGSCMWMRQKGKKNLIGITNYIGVFLVICAMA